MNDLKDVEMVEFTEKYAKFIKEPKRRLFNIDGGVTIPSGDGDLFYLEKPPVVTENKQEVIKRLILTPEIIRDMIKNKHKATSFFEQIQEEMESLGCPHYTFKNPDGETYLRRQESTSNIELRAYGLAKEKK